MAREKAFVGTWLPREVHATLISLSTRQGKAPDEVASQLIENGIADELAYYNATSEEHDPRLELAHAFTSFRQKEQSRYQLVSLMMGIIQLPSDDKQIENVMRMAEENGFEFDEIARQAQDLTNISTSAIFTIGTGDTALGMAMTFLSNLFRTTNSISALDIEKQATAIGISSGVLKVAKRQLGIISVHKGKSWDWEIQYKNPSPSVEVRV